MIGLNRPTLRPWRWVGVVSVVVAIAVAEYAIWWDVYSDSGIFTVIVSIAAVACHANVVFSLSIPVKFKWLAHATIWIGIATAVAIDTLVVFDLYDYYHEGLPVRSVTAGLLLTACGTVALLFLAFFNRTRQHALPRGEFKTMDVVCPMCNHKQTLTAGQTTACESCGLWMQVNIAEPRCASCDYLLYHVKGSTCPECGQAIDITPAFSGSITSTSLGA